MMQMIFSSTLWLAVLAGFAWLSAGAQEPGDLPHLDEALAGPLQKLAADSNRAWVYVPADAGLGTNRQVWTWPINLSCVGMASDGYQAVLVAPDKLLTCAHYGGEKDQTILFHDTNGVPWVAKVARVVNVSGDLCLSILSNRAPASIRLPAVFPPDAPEYLPHGDWTGLPAFWLHKNGIHGVPGGTIQYEPVFQYVQAHAASGQNAWMQLRHNGWGPFGNGSSATGGDSGSPAFMDFSNTPVVLFATTAPGDATGEFISDPAIFSAMATKGLTNQMNILDLRGFHRYAGDALLVNPPGD